MLVRLVKRLLKALDRERIVRELASFRARHPGLSRDALAEKLIERTARRCALFGALSALPPGFLAYAAAIPDLTYVVAQQSRLVLALGFLYGHDPGAPERLAEVVVCLAASAGAEVTRETVVDLLERGVNLRIARRALKAAGRATVERRSSRIVPLFGAAVGGALNYAAVKTIGCLARDLYRNRVPRAFVARSLQRT